MHVGQKFIALLFLSFSLSALQPNPYRKEQKYLVNVPLLTVYDTCEEKVPDSQLIYGSPVAILQELEGGWVEIEMSEQYRGYVKKNGLHPDNPRWRTSENLCKVSSLGSLLYPIPDTGINFLARLSFGSLIETKTHFASNNERWLRANLLDGKEVWVQRGDLEIPHTKSLEEVLSLSHQFMGLPYIWGGRSSFGYDCSGFIQTMYKEMGWILPRNSSQQAESDLLSPITREELKPGDIIFFGESKISHVGIHLDNERFIHSGVRNQRPKINVLSIDESEYSYYQAMRIKTPSFSSQISEISPQIAKKLTHSWKNDNPIPLADLRHVRINHWGFDYCVYEGELIVHKDVAAEVVEIFQELFTIQYPIEKMLLIDSYEADDRLSCEDNNSYAFCSRKAVGKEDWSFHSYGLAIDMNPLLNPYHLDNEVIPENGTEFLDRSLPCRGLITEEDPLYQAFTKRGWQWAGDWMEERGYVDYHHFYKVL